MFWVDCPDNCEPGWGYGVDGVEPPYVPPKTIEEIMVEYNDYMQEFIDGVAMERSYNSSLHCASYIDSSVTTWKSEAQVFVTWRDNVWVYTLTELEKFKNGQREPIPFDQFVKELPVIAWPE